MVLAARLALEELDVRREARLEAATRALTAAPSFDRAVAAGDAAASGVLCGMVDGAAATALARRARGYYQQAIALAPLRWAELADRGPGSSSPWASPARRWPCSTASTTTVRRARSTTTPPSRHDASNASPRLHGSQTRAGRPCANRAGNADRKGMQMSTKYLIGIGAAALGLVAQGCAEDDAVITAPVVSCG